MTVADTHNISIAGTVAIAASPRLKKRRLTAFLTALIWLALSIVVIPLTVLFAFSLTLLFGFLAVIFFILGMRLNAPIKQSPLLILNEDGLAWFSQPDQLIRWEDIERFTLNRTHGIHLRLKDRAHWIYPFGKKGVIIDTLLLDGPRDHIAAQLGARLRAYAPIEAGPEIYE